MDNTTIKSMYFLVCPYCGDVVRPYEDEEYQEPEVDIEIECTNCGKNFTYFIEYETQYTSLKSLLLNEDE